MKKIKQIALLLLLAICFGCSEEYDDSELRSRVENIESWQKTVNGQITALQGLVTALESNDYITAVTELTDKSGYTITFNRSGSITIKHGQQGTDGTTPIIGVKKEGDEKYYWTLNGEYILSGENKIPTTGNNGTNGATPHIGTNGNWWIGTTDTGVKAQGTDGNNGTDGTNGVTPHIGANGNWWIGTTDTGVKAQGTDGNNGTDGVTPQVRIDATSNMWEISTDSGTTWTSTGIKATGDKGATGAQGDAIFAKDGIDTSDRNKVIFTLADGTTKITLPRYIAFQIGGDNSTEVLPITGATDIALVLPATFKESDYSAIIAEIKTNSGISTNIKTRAATLNLLWKVEVIKPTFTGGVCNNDAKIKVTPIVEDLGGNAVLKVTIINSNGNELTSIRAIKFIGTVVSNAGGELSTKILTPGDVKYLTVTGTMTADDFTFVRASMTAIECLDLSGTDLTTIPLKALAFDAKMGLTTNYTLKKIILPQGVTTIGNSAFAMCAALESIEFPQSVTTLGSSMFKGCEKLNEITIPSGVTAIPEDGFYKMEGLQSIIIPGTVQTIGKWAFGSCSNLSSVTIQDGVTTIFDNAFSFCSSLKSITIPQTVTSIGAEVFSSNSNLETAIINANITSLTATFLKCTNLKNVTFPSTLTTIGHITFSECSSLEEIELPINIKEIGEKAFFSCRKLREVITCPSLEKLGEAAFVWCESLLTFSIPDKVTIIPKDLFSNCRSLKIVGIDGQVTSIGEAAFWGCAIKSIMLPETVTSIGQFAFTGCTDLTTIVCDATSVPAATNAFDVINQLNNRGVVLLVPAAQVNDYQTAWGSYFPTGIEAK